MKRKYKVNELEFFNNVEIPQKDDNATLERIALITISICIGLCAFATFYLYQLEQYYN